MVWEVCRITTPPVEPKNLPPAKDLYAMKSLSIAAGLLLGLASANLSAAEPITPDGKPHSFTFGGPDNSQFMLDGKPFQMISGEMHPARIPAEYWRHRIRMAKAMGLNTIAIYVFWNYHEQQEGKYDFTSASRNIGEFLRQAREEGMWVNLRPGPYCCGEWDLGGIPTYLLRHPDIKFRTLKDARYKKAVENYYHELAKVVRPHLAENGGPILIVQIENEYGSYPRRDHDYMVWLRDLWIKEGVPGPFYTADGAGEGYLRGIVIPGVAVGLDTGTREADFALARRLNPGVPVMSAEVYPGWLRHWGEGNWRASNVSKLVKLFMDTKRSFNLYMFHGGTNFGFTAGANNGGAGYEPDVTSYDYGSPLDEQGRPTPAYHALRKQLAAYLPAGEELPKIPAEIPAMKIASIAVDRWSGLWEQLPAPVVVKRPQSFESIGQNQGIMIYRTKIPAGGKRRLKMTNLHDYAQVFVDGASIGTLDRRRGQREIDLPAGAQEATLELLVEAMGHINFTIAMDSDRKGIYGEVKLGDLVLENWEMLPLPLNDTWIGNLSKTDATGRPGGIFKGQFNLNDVADTFLDMSKWKKGVVWINGHNLGRYWSIGPQQRLYCPAPWLKQGENTLVVLDLELTKPQPLDAKPNRN
jgi:beta-galactosidase